MKGQHFLFARLAETMSVLKNEDVWWTETSATVHCWCPVDLHVKSPSVFWRCKFDLALSIQQSLFESFDVPFLKPLRALSLGPLKSLLSSSLQCA